MNPEPNASSSSPHSVSSGISVCGVGGAGARIVRLLTALPHGVECWTLDTEREPPGLAGVPRLEIGFRLTRGQGCGGDTTQAQQAAEAELARIKERLRPGLLILVTGTGGGVGAGMSPVVARCAREAGALVLALALEPFDFEGSLRRHNADQCLGALQGASDAVLRLPNQAITRLAPDTTAFGDLLSVANGHAVQVVEALVRLLCESTFSPLGFAELERWARGRQAEGVAAFAAAEGPDRIRELWTALEQHPFLQPAGRLEQAGGVLLHLQGGSDLRLDELESVHQSLQRHCPRAQILVGAGVDPTVTGRISAFLLVVKNGVGLPKGAADRQAPAEIYRPVPMNPLIFEDAPASGSIAAGRSGLDQPLKPLTSSRAVANASGRKPQQQQFNFVPPWTGHFDPAEGTIHGGENLDEPTFVRRGVKLN